MVIRLACLITLLGLSLNVFAKGFTAQVDRLSIGMSEHVQLVLTLADVNGRGPNISALNKDFTIVQRSNSSNMSIINGVVSQEVKWVFLLEPKRKGTLTIPSFTSGSFKSEAINIEVGDSPVAQSTSDAVLLEVEIRPLNPYVKSQVLYTQRLYFAEQLVNNASLDQPKLAQGDADIFFLGSTNPKRTQRNGKPYQLIERYYSVFPSSIGELSFEPSVFRGSVADARRQRGFNMPMFNQGKRVTAYSSKASVNIAEKPKAFTGESWLPSSQLDLAMTWSQSPETLKAGEPVTLTVAVMGEGLRAEVLPEIKFDWPDSVKAYPEKPEFRTDKSATGVLGLRQEKIVLVANENGTFTHPTIEVPWWNTVTNQQEVERLESFVITVSGAAATAPQTQKTNVEPQVITPKEASVEDDIKPESSASMVDSVTAFVSENKKYLAAVCVLLVLGLALLGFVYRYLTKPKTQEYKNRQSLALVRSDLAKACQANDVRTVIVSLPKWAGAVGIYPATLSGISRCGDSALEAQVAELSHANYSQDTQAWNGRQLLLAINDYNHPRKTEGKEESLAALHPY